MDRAAAEEKARRASVAADAARIKRPPEGPAPSSSTPVPASEAFSNGERDAKRIKREHDPASANFLASFDFSSLPASLVSDLIVANLQAFGEAELQARVAAHRAAMRVPGSGAQLALGTAMSVEQGGGAATEVQVKAKADRAVDGVPPKDETEVEAITVKEEVINPLDMNVEGDEIEYEPERLNQEVRPFRRILDNGSLGPHSSLERMQQQRMKLLRNSWLRMRT
jgi:symplekin